MPEIEMVHLSEKGLISQTFRNTKTGEIVREVPLMSIGDYEQFNGQTCVYSAAKNTVIDLIDPAAGVTFYGLKNLDEVRQEYPDAVEISLDDATELHQKPFIKPVSEITEKKYMYWLEVLFPEDWQHSGGESFKLVEKTCGSITQICCALNDHNPDTKAPRQRRYFSLCDDYNTPHREIVERCREYMRANP